MLRNVAWVKMILFVRSKGRVNDGNLELVMQNNGRVAKLRDLRFSGR